MSKTVDVTEAVDTTRKAIVDKIEAKRKATSGLDKKSVNLDTQIATYENAIVNYEEKLRKAKERLEMFKESKRGIVVEQGNRQEELDHMDEILVRYDKAKAEKDKLVATIMDLIENGSDVVDESGVPRSGFARDPRYIKAVKRRDQLDNIVDNALSDVRKIFVSRGVVSPLP